MISGRIPDFHLFPLGSLAPESAATPWTVDGLDRSSMMPVELRARVAGYLLGCPMFLAWMEYTRDQIGDRFGVSGGSAIVSDGTFYWRLDAAEYIKEYGIPIPDDAMNHFEAQNWRPPEFSREEYLGIYQLLKTRLAVEPANDE